MRKLLTTTPPRYILNQVNLISLILCGILMSCHSSIEQNEIEASELITVEWMPNESIAILLVKNYKHKFHSFNSLTEYNKHLLQLEKSGDRLIINKNMYEDLKHYWDPFAISVLDNNYDIKIGDTLYRVDQEAQYWKYEHDMDWKLDVYYGLSGKEDLIETQNIIKALVSKIEIDTKMIRSNINKDFYDDLLPKMNETSDSRISDFEPNYSGGSYNIEWHTWKEGNEPHDILYRNSPSGTIEEAHIKWLFWNQSYTKHGAKSKGGTSAQVNRYTQNSLGWVWLSGQSPIGSYHENGTFVTWSPKSAVYIVNSRNQNKPRSQYEYYSNADHNPYDHWTAFEDMIGRYSNTGTWSYHNAWMHQNNSNYSSRIFYDEYVQ